MSRLVLAFGSFDILHPGHLFYLKRAKGYGDKLIVIVARDSSIKNIKGKTPVLWEKDRVMMLNSLKLVDNAVLGTKIKTPEDRYKILKKYMPDVVVFGYDQKINENELKKWLIANKMKVKIIRIKQQYNKKRYKSSKIKKGLELE